MTERYAHALDCMLRRIDQTALDPPSAGFPHYADASSGYWVRSPHGDWTGGFWIGELWLAARVTGDQRYVELGVQWAKELAPRANSDTIFRGFLFWYGAALGAILHRSDLAEDIALDGARALAADFNHEACLIPLGTEAEEASNIGHGETNIDGVPGGASLLSWAAVELNDDSLSQRARAHSRSHVQLCVREDYSVSQSASFNPTTGDVLRRYTHKGVRDDSTWTRAQAWAMLGFAQGVCSGMTELLEVATATCDWWCRHLPSECVAPWDFDDPDGPRDTSGTAIAAAALLKLGSINADRAEEYTDLAMAMVDALIARHVTGINPWDARTPGILTDGCYNNRLGLATANELIWGDYFLFEALSVLEGYVSSPEI